MSGHSSPDPHDPAVVDAFTRVATNVAIITTADARGLHGSTGNVWAEAPVPPTLLVTLRRGGETHRRVLAAGRFAVNLLGADQRELAERFAARHRDRFAGVAHRTGPLGLPLLDGCLSCLECDVESTHPFGAYEIVVGRVVTVYATRPGRPLIFVDGAFSTTEGLPDQRSVDSKSRSRSRTRGSAPR